MVRGATGSDGLVLQSVIISEAKRSAIISGEHVTLGGKIGDARLIGISEGAVVLLVGGARRTLKLLPNVQKHGLDAQNDPDEEP